MNRAIALTSAACLLLASCGGLTSAEPEQPAAAAEVVEAPVEQIDYLAQGKKQGYEAAVFAQTAIDGQWARAAEMWGWAITSLGLVPADHPDYAEAQAKIAEYTANQGVAYQRDAAYDAKSRQTQVEVTRSQPAAVSQAPIDAFRTELSLIDPEGQVVTGVTKSEPPLDCDTCIDIGVSTAFLGLNKAVRLELATNLWEGWAVASDPNDPDEARIRLVTQSGKKVGGSGMMGGSMVYVDD